MAGSGHEESGTDAARSARIRHEKSTRLQKGTGLELDSTRIGWNWRSSVSDGTRLVGLRDPDHFSRDMERIRHVAAAVAGRGARHAVDWFGFVCHIGTPPSHDRHQHVLRGRRGADPMNKMHPVVRVLLTAVAAVAALVVIAAVFLISGDESSDASTDLATTTLAASSDSGGEPVTTTLPPDEAASVVAVAEQFRLAVNGRNVESVAEFAPTASADTLEFLIGGGPYEKVDCYVFDGKDECRVVNGIADFMFVVDAGLASVTDVTYGGGE